MAPQPTIITRHPSDGEWAAVTLIGQTDELAGPWRFSSTNLGLFPGFTNEVGTWVPLHAVQEARR